MFLAKVSAYIPYLQHFEAAIRNISSFLLLSTQNFWSYSCICSLEPYGIRSIQDALDDDLIAEEIQIILGEGMFSHFKSLMIPKATVTGSNSNPTYGNLITHQPHSRLSSSLSTTSPILSMITRSTMEVSCRELS